MKVFDLQGKGTNFVSEILAGITTFVTMSAIMIQIPAMLESDEQKQAAVFFGLCFACFAGCMCMGFLAKQPFVAGPSLGMTVFFTTTLIKELGYSYAHALLITLLASVILLLLTVANLQKVIFSSIPKSLKNGISAGLGLYMALVGFRNAGFLTADENGHWTLINFSEVNLQLFCVGVMLLGLILLVLFQKFHFHATTMLAILASALLYGAAGVMLKFVKLEDLKPSLGSFNTSAMKTWGKEILFINLKGFSSFFFGDSFTLSTGLTVLMAVVICGLFSSVENNGVIYAAARNHGMLDENGNFGFLKQSILSASIGSVFGSLFGCPMLSVAPESSAGMSAEGKSGLTSVTAGVLFLMAAFFTPVVTMIPAVVTSCVMVYVGITMLGAAKDIDFGSITEAAPALITLILIPFTSSVIDGIAIGLIVHTLLNLLTFNFKSVKIFEVLLALLFGASYFLI